MSFFKSIIGRIKLVFFYALNFAFPENSFSSYQEKLVNHLLFQAVYCDLVDVHMNNFNMDEQLPIEEIQKAFFISLVRPKLGKPITLDDELDF